MDAYQRGVGIADDWSGAGAFLWRPGKKEKRPGDHDAELRDDGFDHRPVGFIRIQFVLWRGQ